MRLTPTQVALNALKKTPENRQCFLWVRPIPGQNPFIEAFSLIQPINKDGWLCVGKIKNTGESAIKNVVDRINFIIDMNMSWGP